MSFLSAIPLIGKFFDGLFNVIDQAVTDKDEANKLKTQIETAMMAADLERFGKQIEAQARVVLGEVQGASWLQRNWRPLLMLTVVAIVANNYIVYPYLSLFSVKATILELPESLWHLMEIGVGGYIVGRSGEKIVKTWKQPPGV